MPADLTWQGGEGLEYEGLSLAGVKSTDGQDVYFSGGARFAGFDFCKVGSQGAGREEGLALCVGEVGFEEVVGEFRWGADPICLLDEFIDCEALSGVGGEGLDFGTVEGDYELTRFKGFEEVQIAHCEHGTWIAEVDDCVAQGAAFFDELACELDLAAKVLSALQVEAFDGKGERFIFAGFALGCPDFHFSPEFHGSLSHFLGEGRDASFSRKEFVRDNENRSYRCWRHFRVVTLGVKAGELECKYLRLATLN